VYESRRNALVEGLEWAGWRLKRPQGARCSPGADPEPYVELGSIEFAGLMANECDVAVSPGVGFGPQGDDYVRFAMIETERRIAQAARQLKRGLTKLG